jgi:hypothetical protein
MWDFDPTYDRSGSSRPVDTPTAVAACPLRAESGRVGRHLAKSALCRFCCRSPLQASLVGDSVAVVRFATGVGDDGAAESRPGAIFLFISSR